MIGRFMALAGLLIGMTQAAFAEEDPLAEAMARDPERFLERAVDLIAGFGAADGLRAEGIEAHIALERAGARASALRRFQAMDLNVDGVVDRAELAVSRQAASATARGRLERQFQAADANGDGKADAQEIAAVAQGAALRALGGDEAEVLRALLRLDANGDGALVAGEVEQALAGLGTDT